MCDFELIIIRFIRINISQLKPRDKDYAAEYLKNKFDKLHKYLVNNKLLESLYHEYKLGSHVFAILEDNSFYSSLSHIEFPMLFTVEPSVVIPFKQLGKKSKQVNKKIDSNFIQDWTSIELPPKITLIREQIPNIKKPLIRLVKRYIAFNELKKWIDVNGLKIPQIDEVKIEKQPQSNLNLKQYTNGLILSQNELNINKDKVEAPSKFDAPSMVEANRKRAIIEKELGIIRDIQKIDDTNYKKLFDLIFDYLEFGTTPKLSPKIFVEYGSIKKLSFALGRIYRKTTTGKINYEYLMLGKNNINIFSKSREFTEENFISSNMYKDYTKKSLK